LFSADKTVRIDFRWKLKILFGFLISDISSIFKDPPPGMFIAPDSDNITKVQ
jgi:hypothetical protein